MLRWITAGAQLMSGDDFAPRAENCDVDKKENTQHKNLKLLQFSQFMSTLHGAVSARLAIVSPLRRRSFHYIRHTTSRQSREILDKFFLLFSQFRDDENLPRRRHTDWMAKKKVRIIVSQKSHEFGVESNHERVLVEPELVGDNVSGFGATTKDFLRD